MKTVFAMSLACIFVSAAAMAADVPAAPPAGGPGAMMKHHMDHYFKEMDTNGDGVVTKEESAAYAAKKFDENDLNHDGKVTKEEWDASLAKKEKEFEARRAAYDAKKAAAPATPDKK